MSAPVSDAAPRRRLSADERRRQLISIGLSRIVETPIQDLSLDEIAAEAGISRSLLFHYFPTKTDFYRACVAAAGRRILRNTAPDPSLVGRAQVEQMVAALIGQIIRRHRLWVTLVRGQQPVGDVGEMLRSVIAVSTDRVVTALDLSAGQSTVVHAWWAYVEDRALTLPQEEHTPSGVAGLVQECVAALDALLDVSARSAREV